MLRAGIKALTVSAVVLARLAAAETTLMTSPLDFDYPTPRDGFNSTTAAYDPCGGRSVSSSRTSFPVSGGQVSVQSLTMVANMDILYVNSSNPTAYHQFKSYTDTVLDMSSGTYCAPAPDFSSLGLAAGSDVTLMLFYQLYGAETYYYRCADLTLVATSDYTAPSYTCSNSTTVLDVSSDSVSEGDKVDGQTVSVYGTAATIAATATVTTTAKSGSGMSAAAGGGIGAAVTAVVLLSVLAAGVVLGVVKIGRRRQLRLVEDDQSVNSRVPLKRL